MSRPSPWLMPWPIPIWFSGFGSLWFVQVTAGGFGSGPLKLRGKYNLPPNAGSIKEGQENVGTQGKNSSGSQGYMGPMPPPGHGVHHYHFKVYALDRSVDLKPGVTKEELLQAIKGHIIDQGELVGTFER